MLLYQKMMWKCNYVIISNWLTINEFQVKDTHSKVRFYYISDFQTWTKSSWWHALAYTWKITIFSGWTRLGRVERLDRMFTRNSGKLRLSYWFISSIYTTISPCFHNHMFYFSDFSLALRKCDFWSWNRSIWNCLKMAEKLMPCIVCDMNLLHWSLTLNGFISWARKFWNDMNDFTYNVHIHVFEAEIICSDIPSM